MRPSRRLLYATSIIAMLTLLAACASAPVATKKAEASPPAGKQAPNEAAVASIDTAPVNESPTANNYLDNPDFESGSLSDWRIYFAERTGSKIVVKKGGAHSGDWCCQLTGPGSLYKVIKVRPLTQYTFYAWGRVEAGAALYFVVKDFDSSDSDKTVKLDKTEWTRVSVTFTTGPKAHTAQVNLYQGVPGGVAYADDAYAGDGLPRPAEISLRSPGPKAGAAKLVLIGDSITELCNWRYLLWKKFIDAGKNVDYVGSMNYKNPPRGDWSVTEWPDYKGYEFDYDHEGHAGWASYDILNGCLWEMDRGNLSTWLEGYSPDIATILIGTNDAVQGYETSVSVESIKTMIKLLQAKNPAVDLYLAKIIPAGGSWGSPYNPAVQAINAQIDGIAAAMSSGSSHVYVVDQYEGFDPVADTWDGGIHPNAQGDVKLATKWFDAIMAHSKLPDLK